MDEMSLSECAKRVREDYQRAPSMVRPYLTGSVVMIEKLTAELIELKARLLLIESVCEEGS